MLVKVRRVRHGDYAARCLLLAQRSLKSPQAVPGRMGVQFPTSLSGTKSALVSHSYGSIRPINLAQFLSNVLTVQTSSGLFAPFRPLRRTHCSSLSTTSSDPHSSSPSLPSSFHPLTLLIQTAAAHTNRDDSRTSCESDSTSSRLEAIDAMRVSGEVRRPVMKMEGEA